MTDPQPRQRGGLVLLFQVVTALALLFYAFGAAYGSIRLVQGYWHWWYPLDVLAIPICAMGWYRWWKWVL